MNNKPNMQYLSPGVYRGPNGSLVGRNGQQLPGQAARPNMPQGPQSRQMMPQAPQAPQMQQNLDQAWMNNRQAFGSGSGMELQPFGPSSPNWDPQAWQNSQMYISGMQQRQRYDPSNPSFGPPQEQTQEQQRYAQQQGTPLSQPRLPQGQRQQGGVFPGKRNQAGVMGAPPSLTKSGQVGGY